MFQAVADRYNQWKAGRRQRRLMEEWLSLASPVNRPKIIDAINHGAKVGIFRDGGFEMTQTDVSPGVASCWSQYTARGQHVMAGGYYRSAPIC